jgi:hypothetical protein
MSTSDLISKKSMKKFYIGIITVVLIVIVGAASFYYLSSNGKSPLSSKPPTMSSLAGTYAEQTSSGTGYNIILYENGTAQFSTYSGTWSIVNSTTIIGTYRIFNFPRDDYFTITNNGLTAVESGNVYVRK